MIEAELKARAGNPEALSAALGRLARGEASIVAPGLAETELGTLDRTEEQG